MSVEPDRDALREPEQRDLRKAIDENIDLTDQKPEDRVCGRSVNPHKVRSSLFSERQSGSVGFDLLLRRPRRRSVA